MHGSGASVYAYRSELNQWRERGEREHQPRRLEKDPPSVSEPKHSIAVLPFEYVGPDPHEDYFADGLTEEVISHLGRIRSLRVISRTSSMALKGTSKDVRTIAKDLGVHYLVEGTVRRDGDRFRIVARLVDAEADDRLWSEDYDGTLEDLLAIQEQLARRIVDSLEVRLSSEEEFSLSRRRIEEGVAWECLIQARQEALRWRRDSIDRAVQRLHEGLSLVGKNTALYAALGHAHLQYREAGIDLSDRPLEMADSYVSKILDAAPDSVAGLKLRGWVSYSRGRIQEAVRDLKEAVESDWSDADTLGLLSNCYLISGRVPAARPWIRRLVAVDPLTPLTRCMPGWADVLEGSFASAISSYRTMHEMDPDNPMGRLFYAYVLTMNGRISEVETVVRGFQPELEDSLPARVASLFATALRAEAEEALSRLTPESEAMASGTELFPRMLGQAYALAGVTDRAVHWLSIAVDRGFINYPFLADHDPCLESVREEPGFNELLHRVHERWEAFEV